MQNTMKATLIVNGKEFPIEIHDPKLIEEVVSKKKTGYERVDNGKSYYFSFGSGLVTKTHDNKSVSDYNAYKNANYYSDKTVAENNARADALMRKLRRFAVEHRKTKINWKDDSPKYCIYYSNNDNIINVTWYNAYRYFGGIFFDSIKTAELAIEEFKNELIWYFTEYKDSL